MIYQISQTYKNMSGGMTTFNSPNLCYVLLNNQEPVIWWYPRTVSLRLLLKKRDIKFEPDLSIEFIKHTNLRNQHQPKL